jgi:hypothetical protein
VSLLPTNAGKVSSIRGATGYYLASCVPHELVAAVTEAARRPQGHDAQDARRCARADAASCSHCWRAGWRPCGAVVTQIIQPMVTLFWRPRLHLIFDPTEPGCEVETPTIAGTNPTQRYLRLKVVNTGRSPAESVQVSITQISLARPGVAIRQYRHEVLDLRSIRSNGSTIQDSAGRASIRRPLSDIIDSEWCSGVRFRCRQNSWPRW